MIYIKLTSIDAEIGVSKKKSHIFKIYGQFHCGIAHFQKEKDKSEFEGGKYNEYSC